ncbi:MAG: DNA repair protein RadC [Firmicutes bacterium]|jgi:DNA repair protein RadC|nr:DNA repair protein RadC [Bacillota bacterium]
MSFTIKEMPLSERPREKMIREGVDTLSNSELLGSILGTGTRKESAVILSQRILNQSEGLVSLSQMSIEELKRINGIGEAKACQIKACFQLCHRLSSEKSFNKKSVKSPGDAAIYLESQLRFEKKEYFVILLLDTKNQVIAKEVISVGSLNSSIVHPREVFKVAIKRSAASIILAHNHPSGNTSPSQEDIKVTKRLIETGDIVGVKVLDHIIIGDGGYLSLREEGYI